MKKKIASFAVMLAAAASLAACVGGPSAQSGVMQGAEQKGGFLGLQKSDNVVVTGDNAFKGVNRVVVGGFAVGFATYKTASAKAGGGLMGNGFGGKSTAKSELTGVSPATMQSLTDKAYAQFVSDLKKQGYEVVDRKVLLDYPAFASANSIDSPHEDSSGGLFGAKSKTVYYAPSSFGGIKTFMGEIAGMSGGFGKSNPSVAAMEFAEKSGGISVVSAVYTLDFANADSYGGAWTSSSSVKVGQGVTVVPTYSKMGFISGYSSSFNNKSGQLQVGQPITSSHEFATVTDATGAADVGVQTAVNIIGTLGGIGSNSSREYTFAAREADYAKAVTEALTEASSRLTAQAKALQ